MSEPKKPENRSWDWTCIIEGKSIPLNEAHFLGELFLGGRRTAADVHLLEALNCGSVLSITQMPVVEATKLRHLWFNAPDDEEYDISQHFEEAHNFIQNTPPGQACYVHCDAGVSRSATLVISYLMKKQQISFEEAMKVVETKRPQIYPNDGFQKHLLTFEQSLNLQAKI